MAGLSATYISATSFSISGTDHTTEFMYGRRLICDCGVDGDKVVTVESSAWSDPLTTVTLLAADSESITANLDNIRFGPGVGTVGSVSARGLNHSKLDDISLDIININPTFAIWQKEDDFTNPGNGDYTADGYYVYSAVGGGTLPTINIKKNTTDMEVGFEQCMELEITNVGAAGTTVRWDKNQKIEDYKKYRGKTVTFSIRLASSVAITLSKGALILWDGVSSNKANLISVTTDYATYSVTRVVDDAATVLQLYFELIGTIGTISTTGSIFIQFIKLELGSVYTGPPIPRDAGYDLRCCQRYRQKSYAPGVFPGAATLVGAINEYVDNISNADHSLGVSVSFPVMKAAPTVTLYDGAGNAGKVTMAAGDNIAGTAANISDNRMFISGTNGAASTIRKIEFHYFLESNL